MEKELLNRLGEYLSAMDGDKVTKKQFAEAFSKLVDIVLALKKELGEFVKGMDTTYRGVADKIKNDKDTDIKDLKKQVNEAFVGKIVEKMLQEHKGMMSEAQKKMLGVDERMKRVKNGDKGDKGDKGDPGSPDTGDLIVSKINGSEGAKISASRVEGLADLEAKLTEVSNRPPVRITSGPNANAVQFYDLTSQCDGSTKTFYVPKHRHALMLQGTEFPIIYRPVIDFTTANNQLTLLGPVPAPATGQTLLFLFIK